MVGQNEADENTVILEVPGKPVRTFRAGDVLGDNYHLIELIGRGGMGVVYRCCHYIIGREYALKLLKPDQVNPKGWQRFQIEGRAIAKLDHPNIVKIFNTGVEGSDCPYYVMELLNGESLDTFIGNFIEKNDPPDLQEVFDIILKVAAGLGYAHSKEIVHRDVKPSNIMLCRSYQDEKYSVKIVDFGLAKLADKHSPSGQRLTGVGEVFGSPLYMSPEQAQGAEIDARSDIYSLGCTLFKSLTGKAPFYGENAFHTILMHQNQAVPSLNSIAGEGAYPQSLEELLVKMLAKKPEDRYQSMEQVIHDISRLQQGKSLTKRGLIAGDVSAVDYNIDDEKEREKQSEKWPLAESRRPSPSPVAMILIGLAGAVSLLLLLKMITVVQPQQSIQSLKAAREPKTEHERVEDTSSSMDPQMAKISADLRNFKLRDREILHDHGGKFFQFHFPDIEIGQLASGDHTYRAASGTVRLPIDGYLGLVLSGTAHRCTWFNPGILKIFAATDINSLTLLDSNAFAVGNLQNANDKPILALLEVASTWTKLCELRLKECTISAKVLEAINNLPQIEVLEVKECDYNGPDLSQDLVLLAKLKILQVHSMGHEDALLNVLPRCQKLERLVIGASNLSPQSLSALSACPKLTTLWIEQPVFTGAQIEALGKIPQLQELSLSVLKELDTEQLIRTPGLKRLKRFTILEKVWSQDTVQAVERALPNCTVNPKMDYRSATE